MLAVTFFFVDPLRGVIFPLAVFLALPLAAPLALVGVTLALALGLALFLLLPLLLLLLLLLLLPLPLPLLLLLFFFAPFPWKVVLVSFTNEMTTFCPFGAWIPFAASVFVTAAIAFGAATFLPKLLLLLLLLLLLPLPLPLLLFVRLTTTFLLLLATLRPVVLLPVVLLAEIEPLEFLLTICPFTILWVAAVIDPLVGFFVFESPLLALAAASFLAFAEPRLFSAAVGFFLTTLIKVVKELEI